MCEHNVVKIAQHRKYAFVYVWVYLLYTCTVWVCVWMYVSILYSTCLWDLPGQNGENTVVRVAHMTVHQGRFIIYTFHIYACIYRRDHCSCKAQPRTYWETWQSMLDGLHGRQAILQKCSDQQGCVSAPCGGATGGYVKVKFWVSGSTMQTSWGG